MMKTQLTAFGLFLLLFLFPMTGRSVPAPPPLPELCKNSDIIVRGSYMGVLVSKPKNCEFWVTFQVKPEKYFKKPSNLDPQPLYYKKRFFIDNKKCANVPGPNAMPETFVDSLKKPSTDKNLFFLRGTEGSFKRLTNIFWSIVNWDTASKKWHQEFKATPACQGSE